jgi:hypothetical protein
MGTRPRSAFVMKLKTRRCGKCGAALNEQAKHCKRCAAPTPRPKKKKKKKKNKKK